MKTWQLTAPGIEHLVHRETRDPVPGPGELLIRQRAASFNFLDVAVLNGDYPAACYPVVPVADAAGTVAGIGPGVTGWALGERVMPHFKSAWIAGPVGPQANREMRGVNRPGALAEYAAARADAVVRVPAHLDDLQAATLPIAATTAWNGLRAGRAGPGRTVLVLGTGGVSVMALQLAKAAGARVIVTSSSDDKLERARALGADEGVNYRRTPDWEREVLRLTDGEGVQLVIESGGASTFNRSIASTAWGGTVFTIGFLSGGRIDLDAMPVIERGLRIQGSNTGSAADLAEAAAAIAAHRIVPVVDRVFGWDEAADAYRSMADGARFGKVGLVIDGAEAR